MKTRRQSNRELIRAGGTAALHRGSLGAEFGAQFPVGRRALLLLPVMAMLLAACSVQNSTDAGSAPQAGSAQAETPLAALRTLDAASSAEFRGTFDAAKDRTRFIVALSPT